MDGCFDMMHYGHANAMRQAKALGDELVLGLIPDSEILMAKGPPVMNDAERKTMVESVKWVDEVIEGAPPAWLPCSCHVCLLAMRLLFRCPPSDGTWPCLQVRGCAFGGRCAAARVCLLSGVPAPAAPD